MKSPSPASNSCLIKSEEKFVTEVESKDPLDDVIFVSVSKPTEEQVEDQEN